MVKMFIPGAVIFSIAMNWLVSLWSWPSEWPDFGPDGLGGLSTEDKAKLLAEEIVIPEEPLILGDGQTIVTAALLLNEPIERVWLLLSQPENQAEYLVEIKEAKCLKREESWDRVYFKIEILGLDLEFTVNHRYLPEIKAIYWTLDLETENDLKEFRGFWRLYSWPGNKTLARYGSQLKPKWKLAELLIRQLYKQRVKKSLLALKKYIETP